jgi:hypothetical protein
MAALHALYADILVWDLIYFLLLLVPGSYHAGGGNIRWRQRMLAAFTDRSCFEPPDDSCNLRGMLFYPLWTMLMPGNFWTAKCSYVKKLRPAISFLDDTKALHRDIRAMAKEKLFDNKMLWLDSDWTRGTQRYAAGTSISSVLANCLARHCISYTPSSHLLEHWVGTHPSVIPCDLSKSNNILDWYHGKMNSSDFEFAMAPRHPAEVNWWQRRNTRYRIEVLPNEAHRMRERFLLPGLLVKWFKLYNETPPDSSWLWDWYPDGDVWRQGVKEHGSNVVRALTSKYVDKSIEEG